MDFGFLKWVGKKACILAYLFNYASNQHCEFWASHIPFLHNIKDSIPPCEACLYSHNWSLAQAHQQSPLGVSQSSNSMRDARGKPKDGLWFNVQKQPVPESGGASMAEKPYLDSKLDSHQGSSKLA